MARLNVALKRPVEFTHEGGKTYNTGDALDKLRRSVCSCLLWEDEFYEDGEAIADRIVALAKQVAPQDLADLAVEVRSVMNLRHVPLVLLAVLCKTGAGVPGLVSNAIANTIQRADELSEFVAVYAKINGVHVNSVKKKLSAQAKKGLAKAFAKFDEYRLAKYASRESAVKLRDVLFLSHPNPQDRAQKSLWKKLAENKLTSPPTWEVRLSSGEDKKKVFTEMLKDDELGYLALLRNLRNMAEAGVDPDLIKQAIKARKDARRVLPFRYVAAARVVPQFDAALDAALIDSVKEMPKLPGKTFVYVDLSGSMDAKVSPRSEMKRWDAAAALASVINGDLRVFSFSTTVNEVPARRGLAGISAILGSNGGGTDIGNVVRHANFNMKKEDRLIIITDEQSATSVEKPRAEKAYMINVASYRNGINYGDWVHIDGFSEGVLRFIYEHEGIRVERPKTDGAAIRSAIAADQVARVKTKAKAKARAKTVKSAPRKSKSRARSSRR